MIEYFNEDCMVGMARYPDKYFDLAIVDPPYGIGADSKNSIAELKCADSAALSKDYGAQKWDSAPPPQNISLNCKECLRSLSCGE